MSINSRPDITFEIEEAYNAWKDETGTKAAFVTKAGGYENAKAIESILGKGKNISLPFNTTVTPLPPRNTKISDASILGRRFRRVKKSSDRQDKAERVSIPSTSGRIPPIMAVLISVGIIFALFISNIYSVLGILLLSFTVGFHFLSLIWLEILTLPSFKHRKEFEWTWGLWSFLLVISIITSIMIIAVDFIPTMSSDNFSLLFNDSNTFHPFMKIALFFQISSNLFLISSMKNVTKFNNKLIRSPWTIASLISLISVVLPIIFIENIYDLTLTVDLTLINFSAIIIASSAMIYGRSANSSLSMIVLSVITPSILGFIILLQQGNSLENRDFTIIFTYLIAPLMLNVITWMIIPSKVIKLKSKDVDTPDSKLVIPNLIIFITLIGCVIYFSFQSNRMAIVLIPLLFSYTIFSHEHNTRVGGPKLKVHGIIARDTKKVDIKNKKIKLNFSILGATETGKTSFTAALWTLLQTRELRKIWWSKYIVIEDHKILSDYGKGGVNGKNLLTLAESGGCKTVEEMLDQRISKQSCKDWIKNLDFPIPDKNTPFPFSIQSFGQSEKQLNDLKNHLVDPENRALPEPTADPGKIKMTMIFHADVEIIRPSFLLGRARNSLKEREICEIELDIETWDINGESFSAAVQITRDFLNSNPQLSSQSTMKPINQSEVDDLGREFSLANAEHVEDARKLFLHSSHSFLIVDTDDLLDKGDSKGVEQFIRLMRLINKKGDSKLERLQIILNKADKLFKRNDEYGLEHWNDMNNTEKSELIINDATNNALDELKYSGMDVGVGFTCTFGGLVPDLDENNKKKKGEFLAPYPMIPVNVIEPFIDVILGSNLSYDDS